MVSSGGASRRVVLYWYVALFCVVWCCVVVCGFGSRCSMVPYVVGYRGGALMATGVVVGLVCLVAALLLFSAAVTIVLVEDGQRVDACMVAMLLLMAFVPRGLLPLLFGFGGAQGQARLICFGSPYRFLLVSLPLICTRWFCRRPRGSASMLLCLVVCTVSYLAYIASMCFGSCTSSCLCTRERVVLVAASYLAAL